MKLKYLVIMVLVFTCLNSGVVVAESDGLLPPCGYFGDLDSDGFVTSDDRDLMLLHSVGAGDFTAEQVSRADLDGNGQSGDAVDVNLLAQFVAGDISTFDVCSTLKLSQLSSENGVYFSKIESLNFSLPPKELFKQNIYSLNSPLKIAVVEIEPLNSVGIEVNTMSFSAHIQKFKQFMEEISNGKVLVDENYEVLPKEYINVSITSSSEASVYVQEIFNKYYSDPEYKGYVLLAYVDALQFDTALNFGGSNDTIIKVMFIT